MAWVRFREDYNWRASKRGMVQYRAGQSLNVPRRCADEAIAAGKAEVIEAPRRGDTEPDSADHLPEVSELLARNDDPGTGDSDAAAG